MQQPICPQSIFGRARVPAVTNLPGIRTFIIVAIEHGLQVQNDIRDAGVEGHGDAWQALAEGIEPDLIV